MKKTMRRIKKELEKKNLKLEDNNIFRELSLLKIEEVLKKFNSSLNGLATLCIGGGMGASIILKRI